MQLFHYNLVSDNTSNKNIVIEAYAMVANKSEFRQNK